jgi:hypothetical protein
VDVVGRELAGNTEQVADHHDDAEHGEAAVGDRDAAVGDRALKRARAWRA